MERGEKPESFFFPKATTRVSCFFSSPSWANADDESSPNASTDKSAEKYVGDDAFDVLVLFPGGFAWEVHFDISVR
jgi:hypothetical protein